MARLARGSSPGGVLVTAPSPAPSPALTISLAVLAFSLFGDTLREAWDPKLRTRG